MQQPLVLAPTPRALADLVARCRQINRYTVELTAAEELRIAALAAAIGVMRSVLGLVPIPADSLPARQRRIAHWSLRGKQLADAETSPIRALDGVLALDEHDQVKILSGRTWRGRWRAVTLWRDGVHGLLAADLMQYLAALTSLGQHRAPDTARRLLDRARAVESAGLLLAERPLRAPAARPQADAPPAPGGAA